MKRNFLMIAAAAGLGLAAVAGAQTAAPAAPAKNWTPPAAKIYAQVLSDETMKAHPELLSVTLHGVPPGMTDAYTMFAGSYPDRIGNPDDPDDIDVSKKGITIVDPRWHRTKDTSPKFVVLMPMRDAQGNNIGLVVYAFKVPVAGNQYERTLYTKALDLRDALAKKIPSYEALFAPAK
ncbi:hypothetical protein FPZ24_10880 [Sphingomonas panacisoli]|uniref:Uncharacterized protein n=1 Tax=Sphingomonas panacisoli TaxID=1813879 RepID=A0A5B8LHY2_9SPHN|nr:hypothetical protein [Sphingomonas panacisoli]QDZ07927.1 hypothetical protein FPZ24_10880 [Sphingomonas panacisoli]